MITAIYTAFFALALTAMTFNVARLRYKHRVVLGAGESQELERHIRAHGNFVETVPMALILMILIEAMAGQVWVLHWLGVLMLISRASHFVGLTTGKGYGPYRMGGMLLTFAVYLIGAGLCLFLAFR